MQVVAEQEPGFGPVRRQLHGALPQAEHRPVAHPPGQQIRREREHQGPLARVETVACSPGPPRATVGPAGPQLRVGEAEGGQHQRRVEIERPVEVPFRVVVVRAPVGSDPQQVGAERLRRRAGQRRQPAPGLARPRGQQLRRDAVDQGDEAVAGAGGTDRRDGAILRHVEQLRLQRDAFRCRDQAAQHHAARAQRAADAQRFRW